MSLRPVPTIVLTASLALLPVACSDDSGDETAAVDPDACNTSLDVVDVGEPDAQFGAELIVAEGGPGVDEDEMRIAISGFDLPDGAVPADDLAAPEGANLLVVTLAAPDGGFAAGQTFTDGSEAADGEITTIALHRGPDEVELDTTTVTLGEISDTIICGAIETSGTGVQGEFKAGRADEASVGDDTTTATGDPADPSTTTSAADTTTTAP